MYDILIVDDEKFEREGIKYLLDKYGIELNVAEADNGKDAYEYILKNKVDILYTDIKMQYMDGLKLVESIRIFNTDIKIIISSAYGEFEYAKQAIAFNVEHYILKPVDIDEFIDVMKVVINSINLEELKRERTNRMIEGYNKGVKYEKEKILLDLIHGAPIDNLMMSRLSNSNIDFNNKFIKMVLIHVNVKFFDLLDLNLEVELRKFIDTPFYYINLNEYQSIIFIISNKEINTFAVRDLTIRLKELFCENNSVKTCIVFGENLTTLIGIHNEYGNMEKTLDYNFFLDGNQLFISNELFHREEPSSIIINRRLEEIRGFIKQNKMRYLQQHITQFFDELQGSEQFSSMYVKYLSTEIIRELCNHKKVDSSKFKNLVDEVYNIQNLHELKNKILSCIEFDENHNANNYVDSNKKVINEVIRIIHMEYSNDLSLEMIASRVYLSPSYLSHLFKKEFGESMVKFITSYRLEKACDYLTITNKKIAHISKEVGFSNSSYFCTLFKSYFGTTPAKFRESAE